MAMRQRFGGISSTRPRLSSRSIYEDFKPQFELKEEQEAHVIHVHLPGFVKEQVRITFAAAPGVIKVDGQRPLGNNKWSRFNQTFPIQENCDVSKIHGKFNNQILTITIPKLGITKVGPKEAAKPSQQAPPTASKTPTASASAAEAKPQKLQEDLIPSKPSLTATAGPQKSSSSEPKAQKGQEVISQEATSAAQDEEQRDKRSAPPAAGPQEAAAEPKAQNSTFSARDEQERDDKNGGHPLGLPKIVAETEVHKDKDEALPKANPAIQNEKQRDEKRVITLTSPERGISEPKSQKGKDEIPPKRIDEKRVEFTVEHVDRKDQSEAKGKPTEPKNAERVAETSLQKEREANERSKEAGAVPKISEKAKRKSKSSGSAVDREKRTEEDSIAANVMAAAKEGMRNLGKGVNNEEKQMLINMGAAVLVLLALGASVSYSLWSSGKAMN
ncbi:inactive protein RESTRICTED TEV MOVEMENT 2 isoform X1 [Prunus yedoensis var. nudiflora]|uniref:Inactive protein RESTRICTED TEV MOVEMENT 2 isoform X1 n=1 Tax=Prunus yedoensis var. nudiflora TaxID=2094558 RepID=A0A314XLT3_PRUYE|nr:inactive protein RESTRICTED TEV MOVEMENT 2 isoform X1 [Prunus yedoensis var. nudiflora]